MKIELVRQDEKYGCAAACLAMVTGESYADVCQMFSNNFEKQGIRTPDIIKYLGEKGYGIILKKVEYFPHTDFGRKVLFKPFADIHIVNITQFTDSNKCHSVVMDESGKIYCPQEIEAERIKSSYLINESIGIFYNA